jgi:starch synthase
LLREFGLDDSNLQRPLLAMISRIDVQKGFDLLVTILDYLLSQDLFFVLLGTGNKETEAYLRTIVERHTAKASIRFQFSDRLAHLTEAGADIFLMPSKYEPCGLNQMYSLRYGTVPVVRATGGLADTVIEFDPATGEGTGFRFEEYDAEQFKAAVHRALMTWNHRPHWLKLMRNGMNQDFSWTRSALKYMEVYDHVISAKGMT